MVEWNKRWSPSFPAVLLVASVREKKTLTEKPFFFVNNKFLKK